MKIFEFSATVERELFYNDNNCYGIYSFVTKEKLPHTEERFDFFQRENKYTGAMVGYMQRLILNQEYKLTAEIVPNKKYGHQYKVINVIQDVPKTVYENRNYLLSILSERQTDILLSQYPNIVEDIIRDASFEPDYSQLKGIKEATYKYIKTKILETYVISDILALLSPLGVTFTMIKNISAKEPNASLLKQKLIDNPYQLIGTARGLTFLKVDTFALKLNPNLKESPQRIYSAISYILTSIGEDDGHTVIPITELNKEIKRLLGSDVYPKYIEIIKDESQNPKFLHIENGYCGTKNNYMMEKFIWDKLNYLTSVSNNYPVDDFDEKVKQASSNIGFDFSEEQINVLKAVSDNNVLIISGKAGVGKTTIIKGILDIYSEKRINIVTLSAKAARRATEITGHKASTIHKFLEYSGEGATFKYNENNNVFSDIIIVDEASMVNTYLIYSLLKAVHPYCKFILVGDFLQLPPIGAGAIFFDLLNIPNNFVGVQLTKVFRQAQMSGIITDANIIRNGQMPFQNIEPKIIHGELNDMFYLFNENVDTLVHQIEYLFMGYINLEYSVEDISVIVPRKNNCKLSTKNINEILLNRLIEDNGTNTILFGDKIFRVGCRVIRTSNDYYKECFNEEIGVLNGEIGTLIGYYEKESDEIDMSDVIKGKQQSKKIKFVVDFGDGKIAEFEREELVYFDLAYCLTIHKIQGSASKIIIIGLEKSHYTMLSCNLIYTAITRAISKCILVSQPMPFQRGVKNKIEQHRMTFWQCTNICKELSNDEA